MADSSSEDDIPLMQRAKPAAPGNGATASGSKPEAPKSAQPPAKKKRVVVDDSDEEEDDSVSSEPDSDDSDVPLSQRASKHKRGSGGRAKEGGGGRKRKAPSEFREPRSAPKRARGGGAAAKADNSVKWQTLEHAGVMFPPEYKPHGVKMLYEGKPVDLTPEQEEVATMFAVMKETDYVQKPTFVRNFWDGFRQVLGPRHTIQALDKCDFTPIYEYLRAERERKKNMSKEEKAAAKAEADAACAKFKFATVDGRREPVGNFRVEPPGLFRGRGEHPKMGMVKQRIYPRDITINIGEAALVPEHPYPGQRWREVRHDHTVTWLAYWHDTIDTKSFKYVFLGATSSFKADSDLQKYEKARKLKGVIGSIREAYERDFDAKDITKRQMAVAMYFIDKLALRAGHEKDEDEADTVGCCTLKVENIELLEGGRVKFDFLGKDSIRYENEVEVDSRVYKNLSRFAKIDQHGKSKAAGDLIFDTFDATDLNKEMKNFMDGLSVKVFRTYNASITLQRLLHEREGAVGSSLRSVDEKKADYDAANKEVAILCNHQRSVPKTHQNQMEKMQGKLAALNAELEELQSQQRAAAKAGDRSKADSLAAKVGKKQQAIFKAELAARVKEDLKTVSLGTSKINYMDPRITVAWCKRHEVPIEKVFNRSLLAKFLWAMSIEPDFEF